MGTYCTVRDVRNALTPNANTSPSPSDTAGSLLDWQIEDAISEAEGIVDAHLLTRYTIELVDTDVEVSDGGDPPTITIVVVQTAALPVRWWTRNIAAYLATLTFRKNKDLTEDDPVRLRYRDTMAFLVAVRDGKMNLPGFPPATTGGVGDGGVYVVNTYDGKLFGPEDFNLTQEPRPQMTWPGAHW